MAKGSSVVPFPGKGKTAKGGGPPVHPLGDLLSEQGVPQQQATLESVAKLAGYAGALQQVKAEVELRLKELDGELNELLRGELPDIMLNAGLQELVTPEGLSVKVKDDLSCSISKDTADKAHAWLRKHGHDGLIKSTVTVYFERGQDAIRKELVDLLKKRKMTAEQAEKVHPSTLKAFLREQLESGVVIPEEPFHLYQFRVAKIVNLNK